MATENASKYIKLRPRQPTIPTNVSPTDGQSTSSTPTLVSSAFDTNEVEGELHLSSVWRIATDIGMTTIIHDSGIVLDLESYIVPIQLDGSTIYYFDVSHIGARGGKSTKSSATSFETVGEISALFNTQEYTGNSAVQAITTGFDMTDEGFMFFWRTAIASYVDFVFTQFGLYRVQRMFVNSGGQTLQPEGVTGYNATGFDLGGGTELNSSGNTMSLVAGKRSKLFCDVLKWTGDGQTSRAIPHILETDVGFMVNIINSTNTGHNVTPTWFAGMPADEILGRTGIVTDTGTWGNTLPTSTDIYCGTGGVYDTNNNGVEYTALIFSNNSPLQVEVGEYTGTGLASEKILTSGPPGFLWIFGESSLSTLHSKEVGITKSKLMLTNSASGLVSTQLESFDSDGFTLTDHPNVNTDGVLYRYLSIPDPNL